MAEQIRVSEKASAVDAVLDQARHDLTHEIRPDLAYRRLGIVNVVFYGLPNAGDRNWVLIDTGIGGTRGLIEAAASARMGAGARPVAIILTHGHFDHVGAVEDLAEKWDVPVYAHELEMPYLDGRASYPPGDPSVGGGMMAALAGLYPRGPVRLGDRLRRLPEDGSVPHMDGWRWIATPGHSVGHVSLWRPGDRTLIAGDAFVTTGQESAYAVAVQKLEVHGPPMYFTVDWKRAAASVEALAALSPDLAITGHGVAMHGEELGAALDRLALDFKSVAMPKRGRYLDRPATVEDGSAYCAVDEAKGGK